MAAAKHYRVLVVDDDPNCRDSIAGLLSGDGFLPFQVGAALQAMRWIRRSIAPPADRTAPGDGIDFLILDYNLPDLTGLDVLRMMHDDLEFLIPAIVVTGAFNEELERSILDLGAFAVLPKPVEPIVFREQVRNLVRRHLSA